MSLRTEKAGKVLIVKPKGFLVGDRKTDELVDGIRASIVEGQSVLLDLADTQHMTSIPIGQLVGLHISAENRKVPFVMCNLTDRITSVIVIFKLMEVFTIYDSREQALEALEALEHD